MREKAPWVFHVLFSLTYVIFLLLSICHPSIRINILNRIIPGIMIRMHIYHIEDSIVDKLFFIGKTTCYFYIFYRRLKSRVYGD